MEKLVNRKNMTVRYIFFLVCIYLFIFQDFLQSYIPILKNFDEIFSLLFIPSVLIWILKNKENLKVNKAYLKIFLCLIGLIIIGVYSNILYKYQDTVYVLSDMIVICKFIFAFFVVRIVFGQIDFEIYKKNLEYNLKLIIILLFLLTLMNYVLDIFPGSYRYNIKANQLFYSHPTNLVAVSIFLLGMLIFLSSNNNIRGKRVYMLILTFIILSTLRVKAIGFIVLFAILYYVIIMRNKKITFTKVTVVAVLLILVAYQQIMYYFVELDDTARERLLQTSFMIAMDYFPIGTGFGTFASYFSGVNYSPVYYDYNISNVYGLQKGAAFYISDSFWPMIIGQFGIIGVILFLYIIYNFIKIIQNLFSIDKYRYCSAMIAIGYLIVSSVAESAFVHPIAMPLMLLIAINLNKVSK